MSVRRSLSNPLHVTWVQVNFDAIVKQGTNRNKTVFTKLSDMKVRHSIGFRSIHPIFLNQYRLDAPASSLVLLLPLLSFFHSPNSFLPLFPSPSLSQEREADEDVLAKPTAEEETEAAAKTRRALEAIIGTKVAAARPTQIAGKPVRKSLAIREESGRCRCGKPVRGWGVGGGGGLMLGFVESCLG